MLQFVASNYLAFGSLCYAFVYVFVLSSNDEDDEKMLIIFLITFLMMSILFYITRSIHAYYDQVKNENSAKMFTQQPSKCVKESESVQIKIQ